MAAQAAATSSFAAPAQPAAPRARSQRFYHPEIDVLRFCAFFIVFVHHAFPTEAQAYVKLGLAPALAAWISGTLLAGGLGVDLFFVLSSYLITELLIREHDKYGRVQIWSFYVRRALRIWPLYYGFLILIIFLVPAVVGGQLDTKYKTLFLLFSANWACAWWGYPLSAAAHLWSVSIEEQFYFVWPLIIAGFGVKRLVPVVCVLLVVATTVRVYLILAGVVHPGIWCNTFARLDPIACGALLAVYLRGDAPRLGGWTRAGLCAAGALMLVLASRYTQAWGVSSLLLFPAAAVGSSLLLFACLVRTGVGTSRWARLLIYLGRISYGLYVFHLLALKVADTLLPQGRWWVHVPAKFVCGLLLTVLLSVVSYECYEKHFLRLKEKFTRIPSRPV